MKGSRQIFESKKEPTVVHAVSSFKFVEACEDLCWNHWTSTPHRPETGGVAEREVKTIKNGTCIVLVQSGLDEQCWADAIEAISICATFRIYWLMGKLTPHERRFGEQFAGPITPCGAKVDTCTTLSTSSHQNRAPRRWGLLLAPVNTSTRGPGSRCEPATRSALPSSAFFTPVLRWFSPGSALTCPSSCTTCASTGIFLTSTCWPPLMASMSASLSGDLPDHSWWQSTTGVTYGVLGLRAGSRASRFCRQPHHVSSPDVHHG